MSDVTRLKLPVGLKNQERWIKFAEGINDGIVAFFVIHPKDNHTDIREVEYIDGEKVFVGKFRKIQRKVFLIYKPHLLT